MAETIFIHVILLAWGVTLIFIVLIVEDLWRNRHKRAGNIKHFRLGERLKPAHRPTVRGYDYPELLLEDMELRLEFNGTANETKTHA